jgi:WD40 repeat protein
MSLIAEFRGQGTRATVFSPGSKACNRGVINREGDLLFITCDRTIYGYNLFTEKCFRVYDGHEGVIVDVDIDASSNFLASVGADYLVLIHQVATGLIHAHYNSTKSFFRCCCFAPGGMKQVACVSSTQMKQEPILTLFHYQSSPNQDLKQKGSIKFADAVSAIIWPSDATIICGDEKGKLIEVPVQMGKLTDVGQTFEAHRGAINSLTMSFDRRFFATASADTTASTWDLNLNKLETFPHAFLVSCCAIAPKAPHIVLASSADTQTVATTSFESTDFTINFFHLIFQEEFASMKVHKSTVNWVGFTPDGWTLVTTCYEGTFMIIRLGGDCEAICQEHAREMEEVKASSSQ